LLQNSLRVLIGDGGVAVLAEAGENGQDAASFLSPQRLALMEARQLTGGERRRGGGGGNQRGLLVKTANEPSTMMDLCSLYSSVLVTEGRWLLALLSINH